MNLKTSIHEDSFTTKICQDQFLTSVVCSLIRPISEDEIKHLKEHRYAAISDKQRLIDHKLQVEVSTFKTNSPRYSILCFRPTFAYF